MHIQHRDTDKYGSAHVYTQCKAGSAVKECTQRRQAGAGLGPVEGVLG